MSVSMWDILTFNTFIAQDVLRFFYYIFALIVPVVLWIFRFYITKRFSFIKKLDISVQQHWRVFIFLIIIFLCMELCLRILFEGMIGYFDMHNYLYEISKQLQKN